MYESLDSEDFDYPENDLKIQKVHESSHKTTSAPHQIGYGEEREIVRRHHSSNCQCDTHSEGIYTEVRYSDIKELVARFTFKYRPIETLRSCGIVPRSILIRVSRLLPTAQAQDTETQQSADSSLPLAPQMVHDHEGQRSQLLPPQEGGSPLQSKPQSPPGSEVTVRREGSWDDFYVPLQPPDPIWGSLSTETPNMTSRNSREGSSMSNVHPSRDKTKPELTSDDSEDENDEEIKALQARELMLLEEKRKLKVEKQSPRKRIKREESPMVFFRPGEIKRVIDLD